MQLLLSYLSFYENQQILQRSPPTPNILNSEAIKILCLRVLELLGFF
jgi:hypothetical protein